MFSAVNRSCNITHLVDLVTQVNGINVVALEVRVHYHLQTHTISIIFSRLAPSTKKPGVIPPTVRKLTKKTIVNNRAPDQRIAKRNNQPE